MFRVFRVQGDSMRPGLSEGDFVVAFRRRRRPRPGDRVVLTHDRYGLIVKRVESVDDRGRLRCAGDNPSSVDAAAIGSVEPEAVVGTVVLAIRSAAATRA